jgi:multiple sugar transport system permease protein
MMITVFLFAFSWQWTDDFYTTTFYTTGEKLLMPDIVEVPPSLKVGESFPAKTMWYEGVQGTARIMIILPLVIVYLFCQKYLVQGIERSGLTAD